MIATEQLTDEREEQSANDTAPDWLGTEMPPGYQNRVAEIQRLSDELRTLDQFGRLLWSTGIDLADAVREAFVALGVIADVTPESAATGVTVTLDGDRRLLCRVSASEGTIQKKSKDLGEVFQMVHEVAAEGDRVVLVTNCHPRRRPSDRPQALDPDALKLLQRLGVNIVGGPTMFALWKLSLQDRDRAQFYLDELYEQDGGPFAPSVSTR